MIELFEHNKTAYEAVCEQLADTGKACVIHPTGTGKSFIAFKWVEDNPDKKFLWLSPSENIFNTQLENVRKVSNFEPENITFLTYSKLSRMSWEEIRALDPDALVLDEMHRTGAAVWERNVKILLNTYPDTELLGLTATPIRYLDNQRDMAKELFDNCIADSMTLGEAIARGILPAPKYVVSLYTSGDSIEKQLHNYRDRICRSSAEIRRDAEEYLEKLRRTLEKAEGLDNVFARHLKKAKYIAFCANVEHMDDMVKRVPRWFGEVDGAPHIWICVDMFNEGIHVADVDGVILFRPTISPIIYKQQIGRALSALRSDMPLIIDAVNNWIQRQMRRYFAYGHNTPLTEDQITRLETIGMNWEGRFKRQWDRAYEEAERFYRENGHLNVPVDYKPNGVNLKKLDLSSA